MGECAGQPARTAACRSKGHRRDRCISDGERRHDDHSLNRLVDNGHSVVVIEHNLDVIKTADYVIDLGPEGGHNVGEPIACGTPEEIAGCKASHTGKFLAELLPLSVGHAAVDVTAGRSVRPC